MYKYLLPLFLLVAGCATKVGSTTDAPRAIPVKPAIEKLDKHINQAQATAKDLSKQAEKAQREGLTANSSEARKLVETSAKVESELAASKQEVTVVRERAEALTKERDHFAKASNENAKANIKLTKDLAVAVERKRPWVISALSLAAILLILILIKLARIYGYSLNPVSLLRK